MIEIHRSGWQIRRSMGLTLVAAAMCALVSCGVGNSRVTSAPQGAGKDAVRLADGRLINLVCSGRSGPTVLLEAGFGANSGAWYKVQPTLAKTMRVCSYDRAGSGYSDPGPMPRDGAAIARDLDQALTSARIGGPFVVVGHSAGGLYARLFAARRPQDVHGLILLDPTVERRVRPGTTDGLDGVRRRVKRCLAATESTPQPPVGDGAWTGCISSRADANDIRVGQRPSTWLGQLSELDSLFDRTSEQVDRIGGVLGDIPIYVITASETAAASPLIPFGPPISAWEAQHRELASRSLAGYQTTVVSSHLVMIERPDAVISAVNAMVQAVRAGRMPPPLPPSETTAPPSDDPSVFGLPNPFDRPLSSEGLMRLK